MPLQNSKPARNSLYQEIQYIRKNIVFGQAGSAITIGVLPAGAIIQKAGSGVYVNTVTNAGTNNRIDIGTSADDDLYGTDLATTTLGFVPLDENVSYRLAADTTITATLDLTGTAATTGDLDVVITYVLPN